MSGYFTPLEEIISFVKEFAHYDSENRPRELMASGETFLVQDSWLQ